MRKEGEWKLVGRNPMRRRNEKEELKEWEWDDWC